MRKLLLVCAAVVLGWVQSARADIGASVTYTSTPVGPNYQYTFTVTNTGTTNIGTFWVGWTAAVYNNYGYIYDLLQGIPNVDNTNNPAGWTGIPIHDSLFVGYSVEWYGLGTSLAPGATMTNLTFTVSDTPAQMAGPSIIGVPESTSWLYVGSAQSGGTPGDLGAVASASAVPEPGVAILATLALLGIRRGRRV